MATKRPADTKDTDEHKSKVLKVGVSMDQVWDAMRMDYEIKEEENKKLKVELESMRKNLLSAQNNSSRRAAMIAKQHETLRGWEGKFAALEKKLDEARAESETLRQQNEALLKKDEVAQQALFAMEKFGKAFTGMCQDNVTVLLCFLKESGVVLAKNDEEEVRVEMETVRMIVKMPALRRLAISSWSSGAGARKGGLNVSEESPEVATKNPEGKQAMAKAGTFPLRWRGSDT